MKARFAADLRAPAQARAFVATRAASILGDHSRPQLEDVVLIVSELVTNAVRAGAATIDLRVRAGRSRLDIEVTDDGGGWPTPRTPRASDPGGRGLSIVENLTDTWQTTSNGNGKTVTATWFRRSR